ncbi:MAG: hypothetical protein HY318_12860 [Armatimonadetes bacterium]|nr:hypothetical protein [Armatimonadota bacterium]
MKAGCLAFPCVLVFAPLVYFVIRVKIDRWTVERVLAKQPSGFWGSIIFPLERHGPFIVGVPVDPGSQKRLIEASRALLPFFADAKQLHHDAVRLWCVPVRFINEGHGGPFSRVGFTLCVSGKESAMEVRPTQQLLQSVQLRAPHYGQQLAASYGILRHGTTDAFLAFLLPRNIPIDCRSISGVWVRIEPFGMDLTFRR